MHYNYVPKLTGRVRTESGAMRPVGRHRILPSQRAATAAAHCGALLQTVGQLLLQQLLLVPLLLGEIPFDGRIVRRRRRQAAPSLQRLHLQLVGVRADRRAAADGRILDRVGGRRRPAQQRRRRHRRHQCRRRKIAAAVVRRLAGRAVRAATGRVTGGRRTTGRCDVAIRAVCVVVQQQCAGRLRRVAVRKVVGCLRARKIGICIYLNRIFFI